MKERFEKHLHTQMKRAMRLKMREGMREARRDPMKLKKT